MYHIHHHRLPSFFSRSRLALSICVLLLAYLLTACSLGGGSTGTVSTTTSGNTPKAPHATSVPAQPTTAPSASMKTYNGDGFRFDYPVGWTVLSEVKGQVMIMDQQAGQGGSFILGINPAGGKVSDTELIQFALIAFKSLPHYQKVDIAPMATVGGDSWDQIAATGDVPVTGQTQLVNYESIVMADVHPANSPTARGFEIRYGTDTSRFAQMNASSFQPILQSFQFT